MWHAVQEKKGIEGKGGKVIWKVKESEKDKGKEMMQHRWYSLTPYFLRTCCTRYMVLIIRWKTGPVPPPTLLPTVWLHPQKVESPTPTHLLPLISQMWSDRAHTTEQTETKPSLSFFHLFIRGERSGRLIGGAESSEDLHRREFQ